MVLAMGRKEQQHSKLKRAAVTFSQDMGQTIRKLKKQGLVMMCAHYDMVIDIHCMAEAQMWTFFPNSIQERWSLKFG